MNVRKSDRRVNRTRRSLKDALLALILEKGYDAVTIEEITERADLGRTTFYLHYKDKEELLLEMLDAMIVDLVTQIEKMPLADWRLAGGGFTPGEVGGQEAAPALHPILLIFQHAVEHGDLYRIILRGEGALRTSAQLRAIISNQAGEFVKTRLNEGKLSINTRIPLEVFSQYFAGALMGFLTWWLESGQEYSPETMAEMFQTLFFGGSIAALGAALTAADEGQP